MGFELGVLSDVFAAHIFEPLVRLDFDLWRSLSVDFLFFIFLAQTREPLIHSSLSSAVAAQYNDIHAPPPARALVSITAGSYALLFSVLSV